MDSWENNFMDLLCKSPTTAVKQICKAPPTQVYLYCPIWYVMSLHIDIESTKDVDGLYHQ